MYTLDDEQKFFTLFGQAPGASEDVDWTSSASKISGDLDDIAKQVKRSIVKITFDKKISGN